MLRRKHPPNEGLWNGLGGKIEAGETPAECVRREVMEEANADVSEGFRYTGIVTWNLGADSTSESRGMHVFIAEAERDAPEGETPERETPERETSEGILAWKPLSWVCDPENESVVGNIPRFLPAMLDFESPMGSRCEYEGGRLVGVAMNPPSSRI
jgi:8-oxo-dGTP diphosphatase